VKKAYYIENNTMKKKRNGAWSSIDLTQSISFTPNKILFHKKAPRFARLV
jgi:hypothetical protein